MATSGRTPPQVKVSRSCSLCCRRFYCRRFVGRRMHLDNVRLCWLVCVSGTRSADARMAEQSKRLKEEQQSTLCLNVILCWFQKLIKQCARIHFWPLSPPSPPSSSSSLSPSSSRPSVLLGCGRRGNLILCCKKETTTTNFGQIK